VACGTGYWHSFGRLVIPRRRDPSSRGSKYHKWLVHTSCLLLFGSEYDKRLVSPAVDTTSGGLRYRQGRGSQRSMDHKWLLHCRCQHSFGVRMTSGWWQATFILEGGLRGTGAPSHSHSFGRLVLKDHKWLVHTGCQHSFVSEDAKRLEPTGHRMSAWALE